MPYIPNNNQEEVRHSYSIGSHQLKLVAEYSRLSLTQVLQLNLLDFLALRRDAYITALSRTEEGREQLENAWLREQTKADRNGLRELVGR